MTTRHSYTRLIVLGQAVLALVLAVAGCDSSGPATGTPSAATTLTPAPTPISVTPIASAALTPTSESYPPSTLTPVRRWVRLSLPEGMANAVAIDPANEAVLYAGTNSGALYKSVDAGKNWASLKVSAAGAPVTTVFVSPSAPETLLVGTRGKGVYRSADGGATWSEARQGLTGERIAFVQAGQGKSPAVYAGTETGAYRSVDDGRTWTPFGSGFNPSEVQTMAQNPADTNVFYLGTRGGVFKTADDGTTWQASSSGLLDKNVITIGVDPGDTATIWAGTDTGGLYKSLDEGLIWRRSMVGVTGDHVSALLVNMKTQAVYCATGAGIFSTANSVTWDPVGIDLTNKNVTALALSAGSERRLYAATFGGGIFRVNLGPPPSPS